MYPKRIPKHLIFDPQPKRKSKAWIWWLIGIAFTAVVSVFSIDALATPYNENHAGELKLTSESGLELPSLHLETTVKTDINGLVVTTEHIQRFKNDSDKWVEGVYVFPLPDMAERRRGPREHDQRAVCLQLPQGALRRRAGCGRGARPRRGSACQPTRLT